MTSDVLSDRQLVSSRRTKIGEKVEVIKANSAYLGCTGIVTKIVGRGLIKFYTIDLGITTITFKGTELVYEG